MTSIKGHNSVTNMRKKTGNNPNLDLININALTNFYQILSIYSKILRRNKNMTSIKGHKTTMNL